MTDSEKKALFQAMIVPDKIEDSEVTALLLLAKNVVLNRLYPFGYEDAVEVPSRYDTLQVQIAVELWNHKGAEGQISHSENGISRGWESGNVSEALLSQIVPMVGSVIK